MLKDNTDPPKEKAKRTASSKEISRGPGPPNNCQVIMKNK